MVPISLHIPMFEQHRWRHLQRRTPHRELAHFLLRVVGSGSSRRVHCFDRPGDTSLHCGMCNRCRCRLCRLGVADVSSNDAGDSSRQLWHMARRIKASRSACTVGCAAGVAPGLEVLRVGREAAFESRHVGRVPEAILIGGLITVLRGGLCW